MNYPFTSESVSEGHPDKVADQISDAILDEFLARDPASKVGCETLVTTGQVVVAGEVKSSAYVDLQETIRKTVSEIGYNNSALKFEAESCGLLSAIHEQSPDINRGVERADVTEQGAGDQGMMFGYATNETPSMLPLTLDLSHRILRELSAIRKEGKQMTYLRPDSKSQVTVEYDEKNRPVRVHTIVVSTQHDEFMDSDEAMLAQIYSDVKTILLPRVIAGLPESVRQLFDNDMILHVNPTGKFVIGGPHGDTGLTGRKIIVDTYGGRAAHGGGAFSGKDPSKVDRSAAYAARHMAKNLVAAGIADEVMVQVAYAIGVARPVSLCVNTFGTAKVNMTDAGIAERICAMPEFDMTPFAIEKRLKLRLPIYKETASYGHFGRDPHKVKKIFINKYEQDPVETEVELFTWEKTDAVDAVRRQFGLPCE
ncbi:MAG: methionine adenosyltransferase [Muribaculaceae bacterium]|nr:methionine adenosyltransferase [Muribaculaceae bacterium]